MNGNSFSERVQQLCTVDEMTRQWSTAADDDGGTNNDVTRGEGECFKRRKIRKMGKLHFRCR